MGPEERQEWFAALLLAAALERLISSSTQPVTALLRRTGVAQPLELPQLRRALQGCGPRRQSAPAATDAKQAQAVFVDVGYAVIVALQSVMCWGWAAEQQAGLGGRQARRFSGLGFL